MSVNERREVEAKFYLGEKLSDGDRVENQLISTGFIFVERRIETDFLPDTENADCKKNHLLFRIREVTTKSNSTTLLTVKMRKPAKDFIDFQEIETKLPTTDTQTFEHIRLMLKKVTGIEIDESISNVSSLDEVRKILVGQGFTKVRIHLDKFRQVFRLGESAATLDYFPDGMGLFLELESHSPGELKHMISLLKLDDKKIITEDYGDLLKYHKRTFDEVGQRKALFSHEQNARLLGE